MVFGHLHLLFKSTRRLERAAHQTTCVHVRACRHVADPGELLRAVSGPPNFMACGRNLAKHGMG
jgi:hypothetical protein